MPLLAAPFSLTISDFLCSILIICGSLLAVLSEGQISPWCEVVSLLKFTFITSSIGSIGTAMTRTIDLCGISDFIVISNKEQQIKLPIVHLNVPGGDTVRLEEKSCTMSQLPFKYLLKKKFSEMQAF